MASPPAWAGRMVAMTCHGRIPYPPTRPMIATAATPPDTFRGDNNAALRIRQRSENMNGLAQREYAQ